MYGWWCNSQHEHITVPHVRIIVLYASCEPRKCASCNVDETTNESNERTYERRAHEKHNNISSYFLLSLFLSARNWIECVGVECQQARERKRRASTSPLPLPTPTYCVRILSSSSGGGELRYFCVQWKWNIFIFSCGTSHFYVGDMHDAHAMDFLSIFHPFLFLRLAAVHFQQ